MLVLGIETSCDETAVGIVHDERGLLANVISTQIEAHKPYGGVVPEIAARAHLDKIMPCVLAALDEAQCSLDDVDGIAATTGPGLIGGVMVGAMVGKAIAAVREKPFIAVNHLEAHALTARLSHGVAFPYLLLLVSGGHCQLLYAADVGCFEKWGGTIDDAVGECFDKCAKILGLGYPGGPLLERAAQNGNPNAFALPAPLKGRDGCDFSFSGLKTAVRQKVDAQGPLSNDFVADMAASLQNTIAALLTDRTRHAFERARAESKPVTALVVGGGVAANGTIRAAMTSLAADYGVPFFAPPPILCTDNGAMVAWAGLERLQRGLVDPLDVRARPRWPLDELRRA